MKIKSNVSMNTKNTPTWCPGCGDFSIWMAFKDACLQQNWDSTNSVALAGIGCHGHMINFVKMTSFECLHGRSLPVATGIKLANHALNVFVFTGDGDCLAEGGNHFIHAARRNHNLTVILHDNAIYGLTTGQTSPRSPHGYKSKSTPLGNLDEPLHPVSLAIASGATFVARAYAGDMKHLTQLLIEANSHQGFALIDVLQPCVTFNKLYTHYFYQENIYYLDETYDYTNKAIAFEKSLEWDLKKIPVGVIYKDVTKKSYEELVFASNNTSLVRRFKGVRNISDLMPKFK